jgi:hypothetical protein
VSDEHDSTDDPSPREVADAALRCPSVAELAADGPGQLASYLPGERVVGVALRNDVWEVGVVLRLDGRPLPELADEVRRSVEPVTGGRPVHVVVTDVVLPDEEADPYPPEATA